METLLQIWHAYRLLILAAVVAFGLAAKRLLRSSVQEVEIVKAVKQELRLEDGPKATPVEAITERKAIRAPLRRIQGRKAARTPLPATPIQIRPLVFFSSIGGTTEQIANEFTASLKTSTSTNQSILPPTLLDLSVIDYDDYFITIPKEDEATRLFYIVLIPTYDIDTTLDNFIEHLNEVHNDFRIDTAPLRSLLGFSVFGFGDRESWPTEEEGFCSQARQVDKWLAKLTGGKRAYPLGMGDAKTDVPARLLEWQRGLHALLQDVGTHGLGEGIPGSGDAVESDEEDDSPNKDDSKNATVADLESLGGTTEGPIPVDFTVYKTSTTAKEMVPQSSPTWAALTKQGYSIIGSHSGVKICRWTKSALRGRGSCYKYSFYGIASHLCMETTPSLSCSNKCVFCWRHGTNPVGTSWRWKVDPPEEIFSGVKAAHYKKIKSMRGVPGVRAERFEEAMRIRHCALSLVGEPIFYPHINEFVGMLHDEQISSFLVCNAQHPDQLAALRTVTQLYVSIDASNKESLRKIDRPLHRDFWERFCRCLDIIREKRFVQRTVFRLTLVKGFNIEDEAEGYADLVERGLPCFVEVKGVTYCGTSTSKGAGLTMQNVPFYEEVCDFVRALDAALKKRGLAYGIAAEHAHSCCILLASTRFRDAAGRWCSTIDYSKFFGLLTAGQPFGPEQYMAPTPEWALWGNGGFDPRDERVRRKGKSRPAGPGGDAGADTADIAEGAAQDDTVGGCT